MMRADAPYFLSTAAVIALIVVALFSSIGNKQTEVEPERAALKESVK